jgi:hypothetical protein
MPEPGEIKYLVLTDRAAPYLLARVRWPDISQAITVGSPDWLDDPGLFDLPYHPPAVQVSFAQAASVAAGWGRQLRPEAAEGVPSFIRRMPANWFDLSPVERRAYGLESVGRRRVSARRLRRVRASRAAASALVTEGAHANGQAGARAGAAPGGPAGNGHRRIAPPAGRGQAGTERRRHVRVPVDGRAHILWGRTTVSAGLVDLSEGGVQCVLPETATALTPGAMLDGPFVLEAEVTTSRICLSAAGRISWNRSIRAGTHFGIAFGGLDDAENEGVHRFLVAASSKRGSR